MDNWCGFSIWGLGQAPCGIWPNMSLEKPCNYMISTKISWKKTLVSSGVGHVRFGKNTICVNQDLATKCMKNYWHLMAVDIIIFSDIKYISTYSRVRLWMITYTIWLGSGWYVSFVWENESCSSCVQDTWKIKLEYVHLNS